MLRMGWKVIGNGSCTVIANSMPKTHMQSRPDIRQSIVGGVVSHPWPLHHRKTYKFFFGGGREDTFERKSGYWLLSGATSLIGLICTICSERLIKSFHRALVVWLYSSDLSMRGNTT